MQHLGAYLPRCTLLHVAPHMGHILSSLEQDSSILPAPTTKEGQQRTLRWQCGSMLGTLTGRSRDGEDLLQLLFRIEPVEHRMNRQLVGEWGDFVSHLIMWNGSKRFHRRMDSASHIRMRVTLRTLRARAYTDSSCCQLCLHTCKPSSMSL